MGGVLLIFSAPSGAGKSTIVKEVMERLPGLEFSVSATNREPRGNEVDGESYHFLSTQAFKQHIDRGEFVEWEEVYPGKFYGTLKSEIDNRLHSGISVVLDIDVVGGCNIKEQYGARAVSFFIAPPSLDVLKQRLVARGMDSPESIATRMSKAAEEMTYSHRFDWIILNNHLEDAVAEVIQKITTAQMASESTQNPSGA